MESKLTSALTATGAGIPVLLASAADAVAALRGVAGRRTTPVGPAVGTAFAPATRRTSARLFWLRHAATAVRVDQPRRTAPWPRCVQPPEVVAAGRDHRVLRRFRVRRRGRPARRRTGAVVARGFVGHDAAELPEHDRPVAVRSAAGAAASGGARRRSDRGAVGHRSLGDGRAGSQQRSTKEPEHVGDRPAGTTATVRDAATRRQPAPSRRATREEVLAAARRAQVAAAELAQLTRADEGPRAAGDGRRAARPAGRDPGRERASTSRPRWPPAPPTRWWTGCGSTPLGSTGWPPGCASWPGCPIRSAPSCAVRCCPTACSCSQVRVPLGVVAIIYEARPNVTVDAAGIALKAGNAALLRGSASAYRVEPGAGRDPVRRRGRRRAAGGCGAAGAGHRPGIGAST